MKTSRQLLEAMLSLAHKKRITVKTEGDHINFYTPEGLLFDRTTNLRNDEFTMSTFDFNIRLSQLRSYRPN